MAARLRLRPRRIPHPQFVQPPQESDQPRLEVRKILPLPRRPAGLREGRQPRERLVVQAGPAADELRPQRGLDAQDRRRVRPRVPRIVAVGLGEGRQAVAVVQVRVREGGRDDPPPAPERGGDPPGAAPGEGLREPPPVLHHHRLVEVRVQDLVPPDHRAAPGLAVPRHAVREVRLQRGRVLQPLVPQAPPAVRALPPPGLGGLVAPDVDVRRREQRQDLVQDGLQEREHALFAGAVDVGADPEARAHLEGPAGAAQLRVRGQRGQAVAGHLDLRDDPDVARRGVRHDLRDLRLRVEAPVGHAVVPPAPHEPPAGARAARAHGRQLRERLDLEAPALVLREMPVQDVQLVEGHQVQDPQHLGLALEVAPLVQHEAAPREAGGVLNGQARDLPRHPRDRAARLGVGGEELAQRLQPVEDPGFVRGLQGDARRGDGQPVPLAPQRLRRPALAEVDGPLAGGKGTVAEHGQREPGWRPQEVLEPCRVPAVGGVGHDGGLGGQGERPGVPAQGARERDERQRLSHGWVEAVQHTACSAHGEHLGGVQSQNASPLKSNHLRATVSSPPV